MFHFFQAKTAKAISAPRPWMMPTISEPPTPHWLPSVSSRKAARVSANSAAPGLRTMIAASGPANSQNPLSRPSKPGVTPSNRASGAEQTMSQPQKMTPDATAMIAATTTSTTRQTLGLALASASDHECAFLLLARRPNIRGYMYAHDAHVSWPRAGWFRHGRVRATFPCAWHECGHVPSVETMRSSSQPPNGSSRVNSRL